jgi:hypothetical protein
LNETTTALLAAQTLSFSKALQAAWMANVKPLLEKDQVKAETMVVAAAEDGEDQNAPGSDNAHTAEVY